MSEDEAEAQHTKQAIKETNNALIDEFEKNVNQNKNLSLNEVMASAGMAKTKISSLGGGRKNPEQIVNATQQVNEKKRDEHINKLYGKFPSAKDNAVSVANIINQMNDRRDEFNNSQRFRSINARRMNGQSKFDMPSTLQLKDTYKKNQTEKKNNFIASLANQESILEGKISI